MSGFLSRRNYQDIALNISGIVLPMVAGFLVVPDLIERLGAEKFGMLSICWMLVGYFGILDLGLGRGLTQYLAKQVGLGMHDNERAIVARRVRRWMIFVGLGWMLLLLFATPLLASINLHIAQEIKQEAILGWMVLAVSVPLLMWATSSIGALEAYSHFRAVNFVRVPMGCGVFLVPWFISHFTQHLAAVIGGLWAVRLIGAVALARLSRAYFDGKGVFKDISNSFDILKFGGWLTVTNVIGPMLAYFDRFAIGVFISMTAVTYYTVPFDVLSRLPALPVAMMGVFFPMLARLQADVEHDGNDLLKAVRASIRMLFVAWVPLMLICGVFGEQVLIQWVGGDFATESADVWRWLAIGVLVNGFAHVPYALLQSAGRTDITAKLHMCEFFPYFIFLWWALGSYGITGAAMAWTARVILDTLLLYVSTWKLFPVLSHLCRYTLLSLTLMVIVFLGVNRFLIQSLLGPSALDARAVLMCVLIFWIGYHGRRLFVETHENHGRIQ